jgi:hypothetical protein
MCTVGVKRRLTTVPSICPAISRSVFSSGGKKVSFVVAKIPL